jgi:hypothetical protein
MKKKLARSQIAFSALSFYITRLDLFNDIIFYYMEPTIYEYIYLSGKSVHQTNKKKSGRNYLQEHGEHLLLRFKDKHL